ncbi:winged helix DNA-binding protein [Croceicoccus naphthovorans]|uniref:Uncharacterized protein n=1 Tax=Croceicoccus naphthovorans TaxID=1348774 RepID=A0A0G3XFD8_9SPHN|nr:winged helix DNA-binding protein [Croceicoccus naphthovorans]AKM09361.1 hypothetical protein AB433_04170 [Croceicoccus naphthovorans]MBB3990278.1 DNA-binding MarR family transcriptional regulator [Croceicoccus naphthovorans]
MAQGVRAFRYDDAEPVRHASGAAASISVFADRAALRSQLGDSAGEAGLILRQSESLSRLVDGDALVLGDVVLIDAPVAGAELLAAFARLDMRAARSGCQLIVSTTCDSLDAIFGCFDQSDAQILVAPSGAEWALALGSALARVPHAAVNELSGEDRIALVRLTEQVQMLARKMEGLSQDDLLPGERESDRLRSPGLDYVAPQSSAPAPVAKAGKLPSPVLVREIIRQRQLRARFFEEELFADPAWDILLDLTAAKGEGTDVCVSSLCIAACVPPTTALRWISQMTEAGLLNRVRDPADRRRAFIELSDGAAKSMADYFHRLDNGAAVV